MSNYYRNIQIVKHALNFYIQRPEASEKDLEQEKNLLKKVENIANECKEKYNIHSEVKK